MKNTLRDHINNIVIRHYEERKTVASLDIKTGEYQATDLFLNDMSTLFDSVIDGLRFTPIDPEDDAYVGGSQKTAVDGYNQAVRDQNIMINQLLHDKEGGNQPPTLHDKGGSQ
jgi:hypothetical protein